MTDNQQLFTQHHRIEALLDRHIVQDPEQHLRDLRPLLDEGETAYWEWVCFDQDFVALPHDCSARLARQMSERTFKEEYEDSTSSEGADSPQVTPRLAGTYDLAHLKSELVEERSIRPWSISEAMLHFARWPKFVGLKPYVVIRYSRTAYPIRGSNSRLFIDRQVSYYKPTATGELELLHQDPFPHFRIRHLKQQGPSLILIEQLQRAVAKSLILPLMAKRWQGYYHRGEFERPIVVSEVPDYEFESKIKAKAQSFELKLHLLPESFFIYSASKNKSLRRYYEGRRANLRGDQAKWVLKGSTRVIQGVRIRSERKRETDAWRVANLSERAQVARVKKRIQVQHQESDRVYTIALDRCEAYGEVFHQIEIEYDGVLDREATAERQRLGPTGFLQLKRAQERQFALETSQPPPPSQWHEVSPPDDRVEEEIIAELSTIHQWILDAHRLKESSKTKRRWVLKSAEGLLSLAEFDPDGWDDESVIEVESLDEVESHKAGIERHDSVTQGGVARAKESLRSTANTDLDRARSQSRKKSGKRREKTKSKSARSRKLPKTQDPSTDSKSSK